MCLRSVCVCVGGGGGGREVRGDEGGVRSDGRVRGTE